MNRREPAERFWSKVDKRQEDECWLWMASARKQTEGYGAFWLDGRHHPASQIAWMLTFGRIEHGQQILHRCDNPRCCNPAHLFLGTNRENVDDKVAKRRHTYGQRNGNARLTDEQVLEIKRLKPAGRAARGYRAQIAQKFGVRPGTITDLWSRAWTHLS